MVFIISILDVSFHVYSVYRMLLKNLSPHDSFFGVKSKLDGHRCGRPEEMKVNGFERKQTVQLTKWTSPSYSQHSKQDVF